MWQKNIWRSMGVLVQVTFLHSYKGFFLCSVESSKKGSYWMEILVNLTLCDSLLLHWCSTVTWKEPQSCTKLACGHWRGVCMCIFFFFLGWILWLCWSYFFGQNPYSSFWNENLSLKCLHVFRCCFCLWQLGCSSMLVLFVCVCTKKSGYGMLRRTFPMCSLYAVILLQ